MFTKRRMFRNAVQFIYLHMRFLPVMLLTYFIASKINVTLGKSCLVVGSLIFYAYSGINTVICMVISLVINYFFAVIITKIDKWHKLCMSIPIIINIGLLLYFKYTNFVISNVNMIFGKEIALCDIVMPIGISFFTFQQIAYLVAIFNGEIKQGILDYLAYILYFPKILMGPLTDPVDFILQLNDESLKKVNWDNISYGIKIFSFGLFKKLLLADTFTKAVSWGYTNTEIATPMDWMLIMLFYTLEIYFDFSGYSDMAVGSSIMLNITLPINFDSPYKALSIRDFWKRWHISLTKFFTKYVYIPLGGSRKGLCFTYLNTMIVFLISGLWHGANWTFILWGILHGAFSLVDRIIDKFEVKIFEPFRWMMTFMVVNVLWLLFRCDSVIQWKNILVQILTMNNTMASDGLISTFVIQESSFLSNLIPMVNVGNSLIRGFWMLMFIVFSLTICFIPENNYRNLKKNSSGTMVFAAIAFVWSFICLSGESVFVYFNF